MATVQLNWVLGPQTTDAFHVYHLRRGGGHGVIAWLFGHYPQEKIHYNQCDADKDSGQIIVLENMIARHPGECDGKQFELASFEDISLAYVGDIRPRPAASVLLLRDPFNWLASRLQIIRTSPKHLSGGDANAIFHANTGLWKEYAFEYVKSVALPHAVRIDFNRWYLDKDYRKYISGTLGWQFTDEGFASKLGWRFSKGSSFGETDPSRLDLLNRWRHFRDDPEFLSLLDDDLFDLSKMIFDFTPDLPRRGRSTGTSLMKQKQMSRGEALEIALQMHAQSRYVEAISIYRQLIHLGYQVARIINLVAISLLAMGKVDDALASFEQSFQTDPADEESVNHYVQALEKLGEVDAAISVCRRALEFRPTCVNLHRKLGNDLLLTRQFAVAIPHLKFVTDREPTAHRQLAQLAIAYHSIGDEMNALVYGANALAEKDRQLAQEPSTSPHNEVNRLEPLACFHPRQAKRVIAFSLWGDDRNLIHGALRNAELCSEIYPGWVCRFYCDRKLPVNVLNRLQQLGSQIYLMPDITNIPPDAWRLLVADDPQVEHYIVRKCEARLNRRASAAVNEWLTSGKSFHIMRDSIAHCELVLPGMWGGVVGRLPNMQSLLHNFFASRKHSTVQDFIVDQIWTLVRHQALIHDTYYRYRGRPFPPGCNLDPPLHVGAPVPLTWDPPQVTV